MILKVTAHVVEEYYPVKYHTVRTIETATTIRGVIINNNYAKNRGNRENRERVAKSQ